MLARAFVAAVFLITQSVKAHADDWPWPVIGRITETTRLFTNDYIGDGHDRWRTGSYSLSLVNRYADGNAYELRFRTELIAPDRLRAKISKQMDRPLAGILAFGMFRNIPLSGDARTDLHFGTELALVGPSSGQVGLMRMFHSATGMDGPSSYVLDRQIPDALHLTFNAEIGRSIGGANWSVRPFVEVQAGLESFARVGADAIFGPSAHTYATRDVVTGWRIPTNSKRSDRRGLNLLAGVDYTHVFDSQLLPGLTLKPRTRARLGAMYESGSKQVFFGVAYLSPEFSEQGMTSGNRSGQVVGSLSLRISF